MNPQLLKSIEEISALPIVKEREKFLIDILQYCDKSIKEFGRVQLNFICTHNSRRSQFSQVWCATLAAYFNLPVQAFSGGVEVTACNERTIAALEKQGFSITKPQGNNPHYEVYFSAEASPVLLFSKLYNDPSCPTENFAALMTCDHADENCPYIPGAAARLSFRFEDPKAFDDTPLESKMYQTRSFQIASELYFVLSKLSANV